MAVKTITPGIESVIRETVANPATGPQFQEHARGLIRERCKRDPHFLLFHVLGYKDVVDPLQVSLIERWIKRNNRLYTLWLIPRGHLKTSVWTIGMTVWELLIDPTLRILIVNAVYGNAKEIMGEIRAHFDNNEVLRWLFPEFCVDLNENKKKCKRAKWTDERMDFPNGNRVGTKEGNLQCLGVEMSLVSKHYDLMIFDDAVNDQNISTPEYLHKIWMWFRNSFQLRHSPTGSRIKVIGTRWHFDDIYGRIIKSEKKRRAAGKKARWLIYRRKAKEVHDGINSPIWPERFTHAALDEIKEEVGPFIYSHQYDNEPVSAEDAIFPKAQIKFCDEFEVPANVVNFASIDLSEDTDTGRDFTVLTVASFDAEGNMYVRNMVRGRFLPLQCVELVKTAVEIWDVKKVVIETVGFQHSILRFYKAYADEQGFHIPWHEVKRGRQTKFQRWLGLQPTVARGKFYVVEDCPHKQDLIDEMTQLTATHMPSNDDCLDTVSDIHTIYYKAPVVPKKEGPPAGSLDHLYPLDEIQEWEDGYEAEQGVEFVPTGGWR